MYECVWPAPVVNEGVFFPPKNSSLPGTTHFHSEANRVTGRTARTTKHLHQRYHVSVTPAHRGRWKRQRTIIQPVQVSCAFTDTARVRTVKESKETTPRRLTAGMHQTVSQLEQEQTTEHQNGLYPVLTAAASTPTPTI